MIESAGSVTKKVLCFTWFLGNMALAYIRVVVSLVTNVVYRLRIADTGEMFVVGKARAVNRERAGAAR